AAKLLDARAGRPHDADMTARHFVPEAKADAIDDRGAAVRPHEQQPAAQRLVLEQNLVSDRDVVGKAENAEACIQRVPAWPRAVLPWHRDDGQVGTRQATGRPSNTTG